MIPLRFANLCGVFALGVIASLAPVSAQEPGRVRISKPKAESAPGVVQMSGRSTTAARAGQVIRAQSPEETAYAGPSGEAVQPNAYAGTQPVPPVQYAPQPHQHAAQQGTLVSWRNGMRRFAMETEDRFEEYQSQADANYDSTCGPDTGRATYIGDWRSAQYAPGSLRARTQAASFRHEMHTAAFVNYMTGQHTYPIEYAGCEPGGFCHIADPARGSAFCDYWKCKFGYFIPTGNGGAGTPLAGKYSRVYPQNPSYQDGRDSQIYAAQGYGVPVAVPLAPVVGHQYNYSWGTPASRLTPISRLAQ